MLVDLNLTMLSGQPPHFIWIKKDNSFLRALNGKIIELRQEDKKIVLSNRKNTDLLLRKRDNLEKIYKKISTDSFMKKAIKDYTGLRITKSDLWETIACFIASSYSSIPKTRNCIQNLMKKYGERVEELNEFPLIESIARARENEIKKCGFGFRAPYLKETAKKLIEEDFSSFNSREEAKEFLMDCTGIGEKVSECVCLFGYGFLESFPVDVWVKRGMQEVYFNGRETKNKKIIEKAEELWNGFKGYAQQYLYFEFMSKKRR